MRCWQLLSSYVVSVFTWQLYVTNPSLCTPVHVLLLLSLLPQHTLADYSSLQELLEQELVYVAEQIQRAPDNESAWNYLWGLFSLPGCPQHEMGRQDKVREMLVMMFARQS